MAIPSRRWSSLQSSQNLRLDRDPQHGGGLIGNHQVGPADDGHGDHHPLAKTGAVIARILLEDFVALADPDQLESFQDLFAGLGSG